ncbi:MAG TPA: hypothetical protein ENJ28_06400 [Gammaproteobacteria bacterium]|nr:hypothetical protein [Gammaproteobacteria bacterium]
MAIKNTLTKMATLLLFLMPLMTIAADEKQVDPYAEAKAEPKEGEIPVVRLADIKNGKHSKEKQKNNEEPSTPKIVKKQQSSNPNKQTEKKIKKKEKPKKVAKIVSEEKPKQKVEPKQKEAPALKVKQKKEIDIDLMEAYSAVMGITNKKASKKAIKKDTTKATPPVAQKPPAPTKRQSVTTNRNTSTSNRVGWLYLGKFTQGKWVTKGKQVLGLKDVLPKINQFYSIQVHSNIRKGKPSKGKMPKVIKQLSNGSKIKLLAVHNSGNSGHYWARIKW